MLDKPKAITFLKRSTGSVILAAKARNFGADDHRSTTRYIELRASKILIGKEM